MRMASSVVVHHGGPVFLLSIYPVGRTVCADEVDISGGGMTCGRNSTAAQRETARAGTQTEAGEGQ